MLKSGFSTGIIDDTCVLTFDIYLLGHKGLSNDVVQASLKAIWDNIDKLPPLHAQFKDWTRERAASADVTLPVSPGRGAILQGEKSLEPKTGRGSEKTDGGKSVG